jgi:hypothetical protein
MKLDHRDMGSAALRSPGQGQRASSMPNTEGEVRKLDWPEPDEAPAGLYSRRR